jgi:hypothetical protein
MSRQPLAILSRLTIVIAVLLLALPLLSCSEDDDTPTGVQLPEGLCVDDDAENLFIYNELGKDVQRFWLGGFQDTDSPDFEEPAGGWCWCTGDTLTYSAWNTDEPNNGMNEDFLAFIWGDAPVWNDVPHAWNMSAGYIIEYE